MEHGHCSCVRVYLYWVPLFVCHFHMLNVFLFRLFCPFSLFIHNSERNTHTFVCYGCPEERKRKKFRLQMSLWVNRWICEANHFIGHSTTTTTTTIHTRSSNSSSRSGRISSMWQKLNHIFTWSHCAFCECNAVQSGAVQMCKIAISSPVTPFVCSVY